jgi:hypothetical protein
MKTAAGRLGLNLLIWAGSAMLAASALLHFQLWGSEGYRHIPTIGPLFLAQAIAGAVLALGTAVFRRLLLVASSAGLVISSICALLISIWWGVFGWQETAGAPYVGLAFAVESTAAVCLGAATVLMAWPWLSRSWLSRSRVRSAPAWKPRRDRPFPPTAVFIASGEPKRSLHPAAGNHPRGSSRSRRAK